MPLSRPADVPGDERQCGAPSSAWTGDLLADPRLPRLRNYIRARALAGLWGDLKPWALAPSRRCACRLEIPPAGANQAACQNTDVPTHGRPLLISIMRHASFPSTRTTIIKAQAVPGTTSEVRSDRIVAITFRGRLRPAAAQPSIDDLRVRPLHQRRQLVHEVRRLARPVGRGDDFSQQRRVRVQEQSRHACRNVVLRGPTHRQPCEQGTTGGGTEPPSPAFSSGTTSSCVPLRRVPRTVRRSAYTATHTKVKGAR